MRERDINRKMFHTGHYEVIAKQFRTALETHTSDLENERQHNQNPEVLRMISSARNALVTLALSLAKRLALDNDEFDPIKFLDRVSPNPDVYPLSELWDGVDKEAEIDA